MNMALLNPWCNKMRTVFITLLTGWAVRVDEEVWWFSSLLESVRWLKWNTQGRRRENPVDCSSQSKITQITIYCHGEDYYKPTPTSRKECHSTWHSGNPVSRKIREEFPVSNLLHFPFLRTSIARHHWEFNLYVGRELDFLQCHEVDQRINHFQHWKHGESIS